eukprot:3990204-Alexandrium_andersonii.AAC.1
MLAVPSPGFQALAHPSLHMYFSIPPIVRHSSLGHVRCSCLLQSSAQPSIPQVPPYACRRWASSHGVSVVVFTLHLCSRAILGVFCGHRRMSCNTPSLHQT